MEDLIKAARAVRGLAHIPYSGFAVGAAIRGVKGGIHAGCNVENAAYPLTQCAEASAIGVMIADGETEIAEILVIGNGAQPCPPCGGCRQRIREFAQPQTPVHMMGADGGLLTMQLRELLPNSFGPEWLERKS